MAYLIDQFSEESLQPEPVPFEPYLQEPLQECHSKTTNSSPQEDKVQLTVSSLIKEIKSCAEKHRTPLAVSALTLAGLVTAVYIFRKLQQSSTNLSLPEGRFENTPQLSGENCYEVWQPGDFTLRGTTHDGLIVDKHILAHWINDPQNGAVLIERQSYCIHFNEWDLPELKSAIQKWRLDDVLIPMSPISLGKPYISFIHRLTNESFIGKLIKNEEASTFWVMTPSNP